MMTEYVVPEIPDYCVKVPLYTMVDGLDRFVATVAVLPMLIPPDAIMWGSRFFLRCADGLYREGFATAALPFKPEDKAPEPGDPKSAGALWPVDG